MQIDLIKNGQKVFKILPWIIIIALISMLFKECESNTSLADNLKKQKSQTVYYKNELGTITASNKVLQLEKSQLEEYLIEQDDSLKKLASEFSKVKSIVKYRVKTKIDSVKVPFEVKVPCEFTRSGDYENEWFNLGYKVDQNGLTIEPFETWTDVTTITGFKKKWFWGKKTYTTDITASNPNITIENVKSFEEKVPVKWYESTLFKVGIGVIGGYLIAK